MNDSTCNGEYDEYDYPDYDDPTDECNGYEDY